MGNVMYWVSISRLSKLIVWAWPDQAWPCLTNSETAWLPYNPKTGFYVSFVSIGMSDFLVLLIVLILFWPELLHCIPSNKLVVVYTGGQISVVQALLEELPGQFLTYMRSRDIKPHPLHVAPTFAWVHLPSPQDVDIMQILLTTSTAEFFWAWTTNRLTYLKGAL